MSADDHYDCVCHYVMTIDMPPVPKAAVSGILHQCLMHWTSLSSSLCEKLAEKGMVLYLTGELDFLQNSMEMNEVGPH